MVIYQVQFIATEQPVLASATTAANKKWHRSVLDSIASVMGQHTKCAIQLEVPSLELCEI